jgi:hypothetical protein
MAQVFRFSAPIINTWAFLYILLSLMLLYQHQILKEPRALLLLAPLFVFHLVDRIGFMRQVEVDDEGISVNTLFGLKSLKWLEIEDVGYKAASFSSGYTHPAWTFLYARGVQVAYHSKVNDFAKLEEFVADRLERAGIHFEEIKEREKSKSWLAGPSLEDLPRMGVGLLLLAASMSYLMFFLRQ